MSSIPRQVLKNLEGSKNIKQTKPAYRNTKFEPSISLKPKEKGQVRIPAPENPPLYAVDAPAHVPDIDAGLSTLDLNIFHQLRKDIALHDGLFGIWGSFVPSTRSEREQAEILLKIWEKRWAIYVAMVVSRFEEWWQVSVEPGAGMLSGAGLFSGHSKHLDTDKTGDQRRFSEENLSPLDVIIVWHSYLLNPRDFLEDCLRYQKTNFWRIGLPLPTIDSCIDGEYSANEIEAKSIFQTYTSLARDGVSDAPTKALSCPKLKRQLEYAIYRLGSIISNRLLKYGLSVALLDGTKANSYQTAMVGDIRDVIEKGITDLVFMSKAELTKGKRMLQAERKSIRKMMMLRHWENSSTLAIDLIGAVTRQGTFIEKMHSIDWIHSPAPSSTEERITEKFNRYFTILARHPGQVAVLTLDINLAW
ncbi:hypothetical protein MMC31_001275 [Peltigera leucophlebia]|nr:hypothetical protein [Peltigera leucophlebia]